MRKPHAFVGAALIAVLLSGCSDQTTGAAVEKPSQLEPSASGTPVDDSSAEGTGFELLCGAGLELVDAYPPEWTESKIPTLPFDVSELCHTDGEQQVYAFSMDDAIRYDEFAVTAEQWMNDLVSAGFAVNSVQGGFGEYEADSEPISRHFVIQFVGSDPNVLARVGGVYDEQITLSIHINP